MKGREFKSFTENFLSDTDDLVKYWNKTIRSKLYKKRNSVHKEIGGWYQAEDFLLIAREILNEE